jgi:hypothetical protein
VKPADITRPLTPDRLRAAIAYLSDGRPNVAGFARSVGLPPHTLRNYLAGRRPPPELLSTYLRLAIHVKNQNANLLSDVADYRRIGRLDFLLR